METRRGQSRKPTADQIAWVRRWQWEENLRRAKEKGVGGGVQPKVKLTTTNGCTYKSAEQIDFIDVGASKGGSYNMIKKRYGFESGLAIDIDPAKVKLALENNVPAIRLDATKMSIFNDNACKLVSILHTLEHLPDLATVEQVLGSSFRVASDTIYIRGPMYYIDYLKPMGFQFYWSHWKGHTCLVEPPKLIEIMGRIAQSAGLIYKKNIDYELNFLKSVETSSDPSIHSASGLIDRHAYDPEVDPPKRTDVTFTKKLYKEFELIFTFNNDVK